MTASDLKKLCKELGLPASGKKVDLQERIRKHLIDQSNGCTSDQSPKDRLNRMKVAELKAMCKEYELSPHGKKANLIDRLLPHLTTQNEASSADEYDAMDLADLQDEARSRSLEASGSREELIDRIRTDKIMVHKFLENVPPGGDVRTIVENMAKNGSVIANYIGESAKKEAESPKYVDVTITSIGLTPEKYTAGGTPSATADVIKKLAGDPFKDPPQYGSVSGVHFASFDFCCDHFINP
jgi:hypothetical protein